MANNEKIQSAKNKAKQIKEDIKPKIDDPILKNKPLDDKKLPKYAKALAVICIIQCVISAPVAYAYVKDFFEKLNNGYFANQSTSSIVMYIVFLTGMVLMIAFLIALGVNLLSNKRRASAILLNITAITVAIATASDILIVGIQPEIIVLILTVVILIVLRNLIDPSLAEERKLQNKLRNMENRSDAEEGTLGFSKKVEGRAKLNFFNLFWLFFIMCILGYIWEIIWHMTVDNPGVYEERAGFLFGPFSPIYGFGAVIITVILNRFSNKNIILVFIVSALLGGFFEYVVSIYLEYCFGVRSWDYSHLPFNINGRTSLRFFIIWGFIGTIWIKLALKPFIKLINKIPWKMRYSITIIASIFILINMVMTFMALDCWYTRNAGKPPVTALEQFFDKNFNDDFMHQRFENMKMNPANAVRGSYDKANN